MRIISKLLLLMLPVPLSFPSVNNAREDEKFDVNGVKIHYIVEGKGEPVVLIHGLYSSAAINWQLPGPVSQLPKNCIVLERVRQRQEDSNNQHKPEDYGSQMVENVTQL